MSLEEQKKRYELAQKEVDKANKPIYDGIAIVSLSLFLIILILLKDLVANWLQGVLVVVVIILTLLLFILAKNLKTTVEFSGSLDHGPTIFDKKWVQKLLSLGSILLLFGVVGYCKYYSISLKPQLFLWILAAVGGIITLFIGGRYIFKKYPQFSYVTEENDLNLLMVYLSFTFLLGVFLTHVMANTIFNQLDGIHEETIVKSYDGKIKVWHQEEWYEVGKHCIFYEEINSADSVIVKKVKLGPFMFINDLEVVE